MSNDWCLDEKKRGQHGDTQREKGGVRMKAGREVGGRQLQAEARREVQALPEAERVKKRFFPGNFRESMTLLIP